MAGAGDLVGRDRERARLRDALDAGTGLVLVVGEAGIGKTRLVDDLLDDARARGLTVARGDADERDRAPLLLWEQVARRLGAVLPHDPTLAVEDQQWDVLDALAAALTTAAPAVVVAEDVHWAAAPSRWLLERLPRELAGAPVLLVATTRGDEDEHQHELERAGDVVRLGGLDPDALAQLASGLGATAVDGPALHARCGGVPLFAREVVAARAEDGRLPPVVGDVLAATLARLPAAAQEAVWLLAVAGPTTPRAVVAEAAGRSAVELQAALDEAVRAEVLVATDAGALAFRHALLRDASTDLRPLDDRRRLLLALADAWDRAGAGVEGRALVARWRLDAVPHGDAVDACTAARAAAAEDPGDRRGVATDLLERAVAVAADLAPPDDELLAALLVDLAEVLWSRGHRREAVAAFERAAGLAAGLDTPDLLAAAEVGAARNIDMFVPDPERRRRLADAERRLPAGDHELRVRLLGRLALLDVAQGEALDAVFARADEAVAMARRLDAPELLVDALRDRHQVLTEPGAFAAREVAVDEMVELARRHGRPDLALVGEEWRFGEQLERGAGTAARATIERLDALAAVMPSPVWRVVTLVRLHTILQLNGDRAAAQDVRDQVIDLGRAVLDGEHLGLVMACHMCAALLWGQPDDEIEGLHERYAELLDLVPNPFHQVRMAWDEVVLGRRDAARARLVRYAARPTEVLQAAEGVSTLMLAATLVVELGAVELAEAHLDALAPFAGRLGSGNGVGFGLPVDATLGRLALLLGRPDEAERHLRAAVGWSVGFPSPPLEAWCRWFLADALDATGPVGAAAATEERARARQLARALGLSFAPPGSPGWGTPADDGVAPASAPAPAPGAVATIGVVGDRWVVEAPQGRAEVPASRGVEQLARVLLAGGREIAATDLANAPGAPPASGSVGPALDSQAKQAYRRRIEELQAEIDEAERFHDPARADLAHAELEALLGELRRAVGLGGRDRPVASGAERARVNVTRSLKRAIDAVGAQAPALGVHLHASISTGRACAYRPDPAAALRWTAPSA